MKDGTFTHALGLTRAITVDLAASRSEYAFAGWLASALVQVSAELGASNTLTADRPGPRGAELVDQLTKGTVGWRDGYLAREHLS
jgi:hypothetical protein